MKAILPSDYVYAINVAMLLLFAIVRSMERRLCRNVVFLSVAGVGFFWISTISGRKFADTLLPEIVAVAYIGTISVFTIVGHKLSQDVRLANRWRNSPFFEAKASDYIASILLVAALITINGALYSRLYSSVSG